ncbi:hypothetical protein QNN03_17315 [Streptomyces sp. GXMU-J15]|uniref:PA domain-containing protein n=2 Tax=Streptomyces fuscus TaxID=3048495 RepID=A0ABT7J023_9ACTN|nr:PA domain-containing protein [Streptomyces fuscus]MDL2078196.1 hypothetical protein [Streptomyces fuscus]
MATAAPEPPQPSAPSPQSENHEITLVTGDVVHYVDGPGSQDTVTVDRAEGATGGVRVQQAEGDLYVVPDEAAPLIDAGRLDRRLFDVTALVGKAVVVRRSDSVKPADRVANAVAAGAKAVFVVHDGRGRLNENYGVAGIPVASVQRDAGNRLIERIGEDRIELVIDQHQYAEYMYDLISRHDRAIAARRAVLSTAARVPTGYGGRRSGCLGRP